MRLRQFASAGLGALTVVLTACSPAAPTSGGGPPVADAPALPAPDHVMVVVFENEDAGTVVGGWQAPYLTSLARSGVSFTDAHGVSHPSQPNYLALFSGSTQGVTDDSCPQTFPGPDLASQLIGSGRTFTAYSEDLPAAGFSGCSAGSYARKHAPWADFTDVPAAAGQPLAALPTDFSALPTVSFVIPNLCNDMHDCGVAAGDQWARRHLPAYVDWAREHNSLLLVTFDEDDGSAANHIATFMVGPMVTPGTSDQRIDQYSLLRTLEDMYALPPLGHAADAAPVAGVWSVPAE